MTTAVEKHFPQVMFVMLKLVLVFTLIKSAFFWYKREATRYILPFMCPEMTADPPVRFKADEARQK